MNESLNRMFRQLTADKKKLSVMLGLLAVGLLLWGRLLIKDVPRTATAKPTVAAVSSSSSAAAPAPEAGPAVTVVVDLPATLTRDVFALDTTGYAKAKKDEDSPVEAKPVVNTPDKAYRVARATEAARGLTLEGVILSESPSVIINGRLLQEGQSIEGLTVYRIENRKVVLEMDGAYVRLGM